MDCTHVDRPEASAVASGHVLVQRLDSIGTREFTELLVDVVGSRARVVANPDTEVLYFERLLLVDLDRTKNPITRRMGPMKGRVGWLAPIRLPLEGC